MASLINLLASRRSVQAAFLGPPGPDQRQLRDILMVGIRVPDHGKLTPWRFILFEGHQREAAGLLLAKLRLARGESLSEEARSAEVRRFARAPAVIAIVSSPVPNPKIPEWEQSLSAGAVGMNILNGAAALGFSAQWLTDWPAYDRAVAKILGLSGTERLAGFIHIGTAKTPPAERPRPAPEDLLTHWEPPAEYG